MDGITLETVEAAFFDWRAERCSRTTPIPEYLWTMALQLYPQYKRSKICHQLGLSFGQFKPRLESQAHASVDTGFFLASSLDEDKENRLPSVTIHGKERTMTLCIGKHLLPQILPHIGALL